MKNRARMTARVISVCIVAGLVGCSTSGGQHPDDTATSSAAPPPRVNTSFNWLNSTEELGTSDATFIRAYAESTIALAHTGKAAAVYPGFAEADGDNVDLSDSGSPRANKIDRYYFKILNITPADAQTVRAVICSGVLPMELLYTREGAEPPKNQFGDSPRPSGNVFGGWHATWWAMAGNPPSPDHDACQQVMKPYEDAEGKRSALSPGWPGSA